MKIYIENYIVHKVWAFNHISLMKTTYYKLRIEGEVEQSRKKNNTFPNTVLFFQYVIKLSKGVSTWCNG